MGYLSKRTWGRSLIYYCPVNKKVWQFNKDGSYKIYHDMPTYGLPRKVMEDK